MRSSLLLSFLALVVAAPVALLACSEDEKSTSSDDNDIHATAPTEPKGADEGSVCWETQDCADGLLCKARPHSGPPPGAVGLPVPAGTSTGHSFPPGAMGMPLPPNTCQKPAAGEEGSDCVSDDKCNSGLACDFTTKSSGPPPGALGMPVPSSTGHSFPPGAMGMPIQPHGKCEKKSSGPPPGALGMPIHH